MFTRLIASLLCVAMQQAYADSVTNAATGLHSEDGEAFHPTRYTPDIRIIEVPRTRSSTIEACDAMGAKTRSDRYAGCARADLVENVCTIYFVRSAADDNARDHERKHCVYGKYHDVD